MKRIKFMMQTTVALGLLVLGCSLAQAQATRTWVSGVGDDMNPCSRTAPCKTFAGAISKTAAGGEIDVLDNAGYGAVTITKSITIDGGGFSSGILAALTTGVTVNLPNATDEVTLRNLAINGAGTGFIGVRFIQNGTLHLDHCRIYGFNNGTGRGLDIAPTALNTTLTVKDTTIFNNLGAGVALAPAPTGSVFASFDNVVVETSQNGWAVNDKSTAVIHNSRAAHNVSNGFLANGSASGNPEIFLENSVAASNGSNGIRTQGTAGTKIRISNVVITANATGISVGAGDVRSFGNNRNEGNTMDGAPTSPVMQQ